MRYITLVEMRLTSRAVTKLVIWCHRVSAPLRELRSWTFTLTTGAELYRTRRVNRRAWIYKFRGFPKRSRNHFAPKQAAIMKLASGYLLQKSQDTLLHPERCCALGKSLLANVPFFFYVDSLAKKDTEGKICLSPAATIRLEINFFLTHIFQETANTVGFWLFCYLGKRH